MNKTYLKKFATLLLLVGTAFYTVPASAFSLTYNIDQKGMDRSVDPGDDFFGYANGTWMKNTEIPPDRSAFGNFDVVFAEVNKRTAELIKEAAKSSDLESKMVADYYAAYL
ncbi:MAG TPA: hypothetical protein VL325_03260, partial [Pyrinomonadaceae bacterium]|nr:hypothetical protein [Pyrinomonadaceae bacterium]